MKKKKVIGLLATLGCVAIATGAGLVTTPASAATTIGGVDVSSFRMTHGASVRFNAADGKNGIRFETTITDTAYASLEALQTSDTIAVNYGMLIVPADIVKTEALTVNSVFGTNAVYTLVADCNPDGDECTCGKTHIASVEYETLSDANTADGVKNLRGSLVDILSGNLTREFVGLGYIEYINGNTTEYVMAANALDALGTTGSEDQKNNTRSMTYVAQLAIEAGQDDEDGTLQTSYVAPLAANEYKYTVNHYLPTGTDGAYVLTETETLYGKLGDKIAAANIAKSTLTNKSEYATYATYSFDTSNGAKVSGNLYANGRTVFDCYYKDKGTTLWTASDSDDVTLLSEINTTKNTSATAETVSAYNGGSGTALKLTVPSSSDYGAGHLYLALDEGKLEIAENANWDYITFRMLMEVEQTGLTQSTAVMYNGGVPLNGTTYSSGGTKYTGGMPFGEWVDFTVPKALLNNTNWFINSSDKLTYSGSALFDKTNGYTASLENGEIVSDLQNGAQPKDVFDEAFRKLLVNAKSPFFFAENLEPIDAAYPTVTYYIESITWGVDTTAPEIVSVNAAYDGAAYTPVVTVQDNIIPNTMHYATAYGPKVTSTLYKVDKTTAERTEIASGTQLDKAEKYVLVVTVDDRSVSNLAGNVYTEEIEIGVRSTTDMVNVANKYDLGDFALTTYSTTSSTDGTATITPFVSYLDSYGGVDGVALYTSHNAYFPNTEVAKNWGGFVYLNLDDTKADEIYTAYSDTSTTLEFTIKIRVEVVDGTKTQSKAIMCGVKSAYFNLGEWVELSFSETDISGKTTWDTEEKFKKALQGSLPFFSLEELCKTDGKYTVNIYIDSITYSVTANS